MDNSQRKPSQKALPGLFVSSSSASQTMEPLRCDVAVTKFLMLFLSPLFPSDCRLLGNSIDLLVLWAVVGLSCAVWTQSLGGLQRLGHPEGQVETRCCLPAFSCLPSPALKACTLTGLDLFFIFLTLRSVSHRVACFAARCEAR